MTVPLCRLDEMEEPGSRGFTLEGTDGPLAILVVRQDGAVFGYRNNCPHIGVPLNWDEDRFLDIERRFILCANHGALFRIEDGLCVGGPCAGESLEAVGLAVQDGVIHLKPST